MLLSLIMMLLLLPVLLRSFSVPARKPPARKPPARPAAKTPRYAWLMTAAAVVTIITGLLIPRLEIEYDISALRSGGLGWRELTPDQRTYRQNAFPPVVIKTNNRTEQHRYFQELIDRGTLPHIRAVVSLDSIIPPDQDLRLAAMEKLIHDANDPRRAYFPAAIRTTLEKIGELDTARVLPSDLPAGLAHLIGAHDERVLLLLQGNMLDLREAQAMSQELAPYQEHAANEFLAQASIYRILKDDLPRVGALALLVVLLIVVIDLRRSRFIVVAVCSLSLGMIWAAGSLAAFGVRINIVNVIALPMLLGIGIDVVVHLLHRLRSGDGIDRTMRTTGVAVLVSTVTTIAAFLSLTIADNRGLQSVGLVILIGLSAVFLAGAVIVLTTWRSLALADD